MGHIQIKECTIGSYSIGNNELNRIKGTTMSQYIDDYNASTNNDVIKVVIPVETIKKS